ncbi:hypothetical protein SLEP1_g59316 [Rubroshorea leprosula]|uniref:Uncharacterized protein n=1 Tax=Rubroshorea leprosula TaxID=152421 RepID=A0AAV5MV61_9ROSI|nr:hypothetical protein SLEP1_g59316 [Rubroshorea leprosula]
MRPARLGFNEPSLASRVNPALLVARTQPCWVRPNLAAGFRPTQPCWSRLLVSLKPSLARVNLIW